MAANDVSSTSLPEEATANNASPRGAHERALAQADFQMVVIIDLSSSSQVRVSHLAGHTPCSLCHVRRDGRTRLASAAALERSNVQRLVEVGHAAFETLWRDPGSVLVFSRPFGHDDVPLRLSPVNNREDGDFPRKLLVLVWLIAAKHLFRRHMLQAHSVEYLADDIKQLQWTVIVPHGWSEAVKHVIRRCAHAAGLIADPLSTKLCFALEPECAALGCQLMRPMPSGHRFVVCNISRDAITTHAFGVLQMGQPGRWSGVIKETGRSAWGVRPLGQAVRGNSSQTVPKLVWPLIGRLVQEITSADSAQATSDEGFGAVWELTAAVLDAIGRALETHAEELHDDVHLRLRGRAADAIRALQERGRMPDLGGVAEVDEDGDMVLTADGVNRAVNAVALMAASDIGKVASRVGGVDFVYLCGDVGAFKAVEAAVRRAIDDRSSMHRLIRCHEEDTTGGLYGVEDGAEAVMRGAMMFTLDQGVIGMRIADETFGIRCVRKYMAGVDSPERIMRVAGEVAKGPGGELLIDSGFSVLTRAGDALPVGYEVEKEYRCQRAGQQQVDVSLLRTRKSQVLYCDEEGVSVLGQFSVSFREGAVGDRVRIRLRFGSTEVECFVVTSDDRLVRIPFRLHGASDVDMEAASSASIDSSKTCDTSDPISLATLIEQLSLTM